MNELKPRSDAGHDEAAAFAEGKKDGRAVQVPDVRATPRR
jgi:hypothetical protein